MLVGAIGSKPCNGHAFHPLDCVLVAQHWPFSLAIHTPQKLWLGRLMKKKKGSGEPLTHMLKGVACKTKEGTGHTAIIQISLRSVWHD